MKEFLTVKEAQQLTNLGASTLCTLAEKGEVFAVKEKGRWHIKTEDVMALQIKPRKEHTRRSRKGLTMTLAEDNTMPYKNPREVPGVSATPKHAKPEDERSWRDAPRFTYNDLLNQYERGIAEGKRKGREEGFTQGIIAAQVKTELTTTEKKEEATC